MLAFQLGLYQFLQVDAIGVGVFIWLEIRRQRFDQHLCQRQLLFFHLTGVGVKLLHLADFIHVEHRMEDHAFAIRTKNHDVLAIVHGHSCNAVILGLAQGLEQQILRSNIASMLTSRLSLMPQELEKAMTKQEMADLLAFLKGE